MKKFIISLLIFLMIAVPVTANDFTLVSVTYPVLVDGQQLPTDKPVLNLNGTTYVPLKAVLDLIGAQTEWKDGKVNIQTKKELTVADVAKNADNCVYLVAYNYAQKTAMRGSGVLLPNGYIVSNKHVLDYGPDYGVSYGDYKSMEEYNTQERIKINTTYDLGFIKSPREKQSNIVLGDSDKVQIGDKIVTISSPHGLKNTVSEGTVTAIRPEINAIQISADISPGSSGGALFNMKGELIGILVGGMDEKEKLNFAIPINKVKELLNK